MSVRADHGAPPVEVPQQCRPVAVAGGGPVGMGIALALGRAGVGVDLIEASRAPAAGDAGYGRRPIALSQGSRRILAALGVWDVIAESATPITRIHVSDRGHFGFARLAARDLGVDALGYVIAAADLEHAMQSALATLDTVRVLCPATVDEVRTGPGRAARLHVTTSGDDPDSHGAQQVDARLVVICDGGRSSLRAHLGISVSEHDYGQWAVTARVEARCAHDGVAYERFTSEGPLALLPMQGRHCGLVWSVGAETAESLASLGDEAFLAALGDRFGGRLGGFVAAGARSAFPLSLVTATRIVGERHAIVGNAANHLHPVAGQGLNLGLRDAEALAGLVAARVREGGDPGDPALLARYADGRRKDQRRVLRATDALVQLFSNTLGPLVAARNLGLLVFDLVPSVKRRFARDAMGLATPQGRLTRGLPV